MMPSKLTTIINRFQSGELETSKDVSCPICGGTVHAEAVLVKSGARAGLLAVFLGCDDCGGEIVADGVEPWAGWERIDMPPDQRIDPKLTLREIKARHRKS